MRLTTFTDYALRTLMYLAAHRERLVTVQDIADAHGIAKNHLTKVVHQLGLLGFVGSLRGRNGGLRLGREPAQIKLGEVVRSTEPDFYMAECFDPQKGHCILNGHCILKGTLHSATRAYLAVLDGVTLADLMRNGGGDGGGEAGRTGALGAMPVRAPAAAAASAPAGQPGAEPLNPAPVPAVRATRPRRPGSRLTP